MSEGFYYPLEDILHQYISNETFNETHAVDRPNDQVKESYLVSIWKTQSENIFFYNTLLLIFACVLPKRKTVGKIINTAINSLLIKRLSLVLSYVFQTIFGLIILAAVIPLVLPFWMIFTLISEVSRLKLLLKYGQKANKAVGIDALWGADRPESRPFISALFTFEGQADIQNIRKAIQENILDIRDECGAFKYRKFRQEFGREFGYNRWKDSEDFNVDNHVKLFDLEDTDGFSEEDEIYQNERMDCNGNVDPKKKIDFEKVKENELMHKFFKNHDVRALGINKPPWELNVIQRPDNKYSVVLKLHHAIGDGVSLVRLMLETLVDCPFDFGKKSKEIGLTMKIITAIWSLCLLPFAMFKMINNNDNHSLHGAPLTGEKIFRLSNKISLNDVKKVKRVTKTTVNDVLMSCLSKAVSEYFQRCDSDVENTTFLVPVSFHNMNEENVLANKFSAAIVNLPTPQNVSPLYRLKLIKNTLDKVKSDPTTIAVYRLLQSFVNAVPAYIADILFASKGITGAASNIPGPQKEIKVWGDTLKDFAFWVPDRAPAGIGFSIFSYCGHITIGFSADTGIIKDPKQMDEILRDFESEIDHLLSNLATKKEKFKKLSSILKIINCIKESCIKNA